MEMLQQANGEGERERVRKNGWFLSLSLPLSVCFFPSFFFSAAEKKSARSIREHLWVCNAPRNDLQAPTVLYNTMERNIYDTKLKI